MVGQSMEAMETMGRGGQAVAGRMNQDVPYIRGKFVGSGKFRLSGLEPTQINEPQFLTNFLVRLFGQGSHVHTHARTHAIKHTIKRMRARAHTHTVVNTASKK